MEVRVLNETDASIYREVRLRALQRCPEAFLASYETEVNRPLEETAGRIKPTPDRFLLGAFDGEGVLVGIVALVRETSVKIKHKGNVYQMYVDEASQGKGIGKALMQELIRRARDLDGLERINLTVVSSNEPAKRLYTSVGFKVYGTEQNAIKLAEQYLAEDFMALVL